MEKNNSQKIRLGFFVVVGTVILVLAIYFIGSRQNMFGGTFTLSAVFRNVNGLQTGNNVRFSGINIGTVKDMEMINDTTIRVVLLIEDDMLSHIKKNAVASIGTDGLVGSMIVNINPGNGNAQLVKSGDEIRTYSRIASEDMLGTLNVTNENAALLTADLLKVTQSLIHGEGILGRLLNDTTMARDTYETIGNLKEISEEVNLTMRELNTLLKEVDYNNSVADVLLSDSASGEKVKSMIYNLEFASKQFNDAINDLDSIIGQVQEGEGALHYLTTDEHLVQKLDSTISNIEKGAVNFNQNMEALKHNIFFRRYFKNLNKKDQ